MVLDLSAYSITKDNFLEESRNILATFIKYYANTATVVGDGIAAWGSWVTVEAKATDDAAPPNELRDTCRLTLDRIVPLNPRRGNYPEEPTGEDHAVGRRCSALFTLQTDRKSYYRLEEVYAKFADLFEQRASELNKKDMRNFILSRTFAPVQANMNPDVAVLAFMLEYEVTYLVEVVRT